MRAAETLEDVEYNEEATEVGHMLATINPEAAAAIDNPPPPPDVGTWVVFKPRAGVSRMHRTEFAACVMGSHEDGTLMLWVVLEPEDHMMETRVPFQSHNQSAFCWRYARGSAADLEIRVKKIEDYLAQEDALVEDLEAVRSRVSTVEQVLASDEVEQLDTRIAKLEKALKKAK